VPIPKAIARFNRVTLNKVTGHVAPYLPGFGVVVHIGRRSGRLFTTPVNVFRTSNGVRIALTYGRDTDWVQNVVVAGGCAVRTHGRKILLTEPRIRHDPARTGIRTFERQVLRLLKVSDFLDLTLDGDRAA
jgi:deazaflavin-dependent oxidoreductase (nitroreductase family)